MNHRKEINEFYRRNLARNQCSGLAIIKLSRTMKAFRVYRGTKGGILPPEFWKPNEMNVRGGIELGFMSTTLTRNVAMKFASSDESKPSLVFEIQMGMVDRGAPVQVYV